MADKPDLSRRELLKRVGLAGAVAAVPMKMFAPVAAAPNEDQSATVRRAGTGPRGAGDADRSGGRHARGDRGASDSHGRQRTRRRGGPCGALHRPGARRRPRVVARRVPRGLAAVDRSARPSKGAPFAQLSPQDQDACWKTWRGTWPPASRRTPRRSSTWSGRTPSRGRSAIRITVGTRTSSDGT